MDEEKKTENTRRLKALVSLLEDDDPEVLRLITEEIARTGASIIPFLEEEWSRQLAPNVQERIENLVHNLQFERLQNRLTDWKNNRSEDLLEGMWIVATYRYPDLEIEELRSLLEQLYYEAWIEFSDDLHPFEQIKKLNSVIFGKMRFRPNNTNFFSVGNSMINDVLKEKKGNPITLSVIYLLVAQRLKMPVAGVNLPNLFVLTYKSESMQFYINVFNRGIIFSRGDVDNFINQLNLAPRPAFYEACDNLKIVRRTLRNLALAYDKLDEHEKQAEVRELLSTLSEE